MNNFQREHKPGNIMIYEVHTISFQTFFRMGTFIDRKHMKL